MKMKVQRLTFFWKNSMKAARTSLAVRFFIAMAKFPCDAKNDKWTTNGERIQASNSDAMAHAQK